jgi:threonine synthase
MTNYISTRGNAPHLDFSYTTLAGLALDGGLYVPETMPSFTAAELQALRGKPYAEVAEKIMAPFIGEDIPPAVLKEIIEKSYSVFDDPRIVPLVKLKDNFFIQELMHGPTLAFKDVALQFLGNVFDYILTRKQRRVTIVGATSGDTGSAAIEAFRDKGNANIFILHPHNRVSEVQRRQMTTVLSPNVFNIAVDGSFDDCQDLVKEMFNDKPFREEMQLSAVNSINWARILAQVVYYVYAGIEAMEKTGKAPTFCVPTGNFGNVYAGYVAHKIGLPVEKFIVATNSNDILDRFFKTGRMKKEGVSPTLSPSMDIQVSSNFERLLFEFFGRQGAAVDKTMVHFRETGPFHVEQPVLDEAMKLFSSGKQNDAETLDVIQSTYVKYAYLLDPHSAVAVGVAEAYQKEHPDSVIVSLATAHPAKFPDAVNKAVGFRPELPPHLADLYKRTERYEVLPNDLGKIRDFVRAGALKNR